MTNIKGLITIQISDLVNLLTNTHFQGGSRNANGNGCKKRRCSQNVMNTTEL